MRKAEKSNGRSHGTTRIHSLWLALIVAIILEIAEAFTLLQIGCTPQFACSQIRVTAFLLTVAVILIFRYFDKAGKSNGSFAIVRWVTYIGDCSYGIFFTHYIFILLVRPFVTKLGIVANYWFLQAIICFAASLLLSLVTINLARKLLRNTGKPGLLTALGFN